MSVKMLNRARYWHSLTDLTVASLHRAHSLRLRSISISPRGAPAASGKDRQHHRAGRQWPVQRRIGRNATLFDWKLRRYCQFFRLTFCVGNDSRLRQLHEHISEWTGCRPSYVRTTEHPDWPLMLIYCKSTVETTAKFLLSLAKLPSACLPTVNHVALACRSLLWVTQNYK